MRRKNFPGSVARSSRSGARRGDGLWIPASNYYVLSFAVGVGVFFLTWGVLLDGGDAAPWIPAGIVFSGFLVISVLGREVILRRVHNRRMEVQRAFDRQLADVQSMIGETRQNEKLTLERNDRMIAEIRRKSEAASAFRSIAAAHHEVFELCAAYLAINEREIPSVSAGSPRLSALGRGREYALRLHRMHLLTWAQLEATELAREASGMPRPEDKLACADRAIAVIDKALSFYPAEVSLLDSRELLVETLVSERAAGAVAKAQQYTAQGDLTAARRAYRDALYILSEAGAQSPDREAATRKVEIQLAAISFGEDEIRGH